MSLLKHKNIFLGISGALVLVSWVMVFTFGFRQGIDLRGGTEWNLRLGIPSTEKEVKNAMQKISGEENIIVKKSGDGGYIIRMKNMTEEEHVQYFEKLRETFGDATEESGFSSVGPSIGRELRAQAIWAGILVICGISIYIAWAFRNSKGRVASWKYGLATLITLFHDVSIPMGLLAALGVWKGIEIDTNFIVALLVIMGFSVHDTIVVFDRIRENLAIAEKSKIDLASAIEKSVSETMARSINTSLTLIIVLVALLAFGPPTLFYFVLTILLGTIIGTYSSICVASPLIYIWSAREQKA